MYWVYPVPVEHYGWIIQRTGCIVTSDFRAIAALDGNGIIRGMVAYVNWTQNAAQVHIAIENPIALRALVAEAPPPYEHQAPAFAYPFLLEKREILIGIVHGDNQKALALDKHLGFRETYRFKDGARPGVDLVVLEMRKDECKWLRGRDRCPDDSHRSVKRGSTPRPAMEVPQWADQQQVRAPQ